MRFVPYRYATDLRRRWSFVLNRVSGHLIGAAVTTPFGYCWSFVWRDAS
jgi:hypothetical protein